MEGDGLDQLLSNNNKNDELGQLLSAYEDECSDLPQVKDYNNNIDYYPNENIEIKKEIRRHK